MVYQLLIPSLILVAATILASVIAYIYRRKRIRDSDSESDTQSDNASTHHSGETDTTYITILPADSNLSIANINYTEDGKVITTDFPTMINTTRTSTSSLNTNLSSITANGMKAAPAAMFNIPAAGSREAIDVYGIPQISNSPNFYPKACTQNTRVSRHSHHGTGKSGHSTYRYNHFTNVNKDSSGSLSRTASEEVNRTYNYRCQAPGQITNINVDRNGKATIETLVTTDPNMGGTREIPTYRRMSSNTSAGSGSLRHHNSSSSSGSGEAGDKIPSPPPTNTYYSNSMIRHMKRNNSLVGPGPNSNHVNSGNGGNDCDTQSHLSDGCASGISNSNNSVKSLPEFIPNYDSLNIRVETNRASLKLSDFALPPLGTGGTPGSCSGSQPRSRNQSKDNFSDSSSHLGACR